MPASNQCGTDCKFFGQFKHSAAKHPEAEIGEEDLRVFACLCPGLNSMGIHSTNLEECSSCRSYEPLIFPGFDLVTAITTAPRGCAKCVPAGGYLEATVKSAVAAGMGVRRISSDDDKTWGPFGNLYVAATTLYIDYPHASAYGIFQDDVRFDPITLAAYMELVEPGKSPPRIVSLYRPPDLGDMQEHSWQQHNRGWLSPGACAYIFSPEGIRDLLTDPVVLAHRRIGPNNGWRDSDGVVGVWAAKHGGIWYPRQTLAKHVGAVSTIKREE